MRVTGSGCWLAGRGFLSGVFKQPRDGATEDHPDMVGCDSDGPFERSTPEIAGRILFYLCDQKPNGFFGNEWGVGNPSVVMGGPP